jgi:LEA14-like dessication related protein
VKNRYPVEVTIPRIGYGVDVDGNSLIAGKLEKNTKVPSSQASDPTTKVTVPMRFTFQDLYQLSTTYRNKSEAPYRLKGDVTVDTPVGPVELPFQHKGTVPILKPPQIDLPNVEVQSLSLSGADLRLKFRMRNPNTVKLSVKSMQYGLDLADVRVATGRLPRSIELAASGKTTAEMDLHIGLAEVGTALMSMLQKDRLNYRLDGSLSVGTPWGPLNTPLSAKGVANLQH